MKSSLLFPLLMLIAFAVACSSSDPTPNAATLPSGVSGPSIVVLSPSDGFVSTTGAVPVRVHADEDLIVSVNGQIATPEIGGKYSAELVLEDGANLIEIVAAALDGTSTSEDRLGFSIPLLSNSPLDLYMPADGHVSSSEFVQVVGSTSPGSSISLNGQLVTPDSLGIFDQTIQLPDGPNLVEVVTVGLNGSSTTQSIAVFVEKT